MGDLYGVYKKNSFSRIPPTPIGLKNILKNGNFYCEYAEGFDINFFETREIFVFVFGFLSNINELATNKSLENLNNAELISLLYLEDKNNFQKKLMGNFSIFIFDKKLNSLLIIRDHFGSRPIYIYENEDALIVSDEIETLVNSLDINLSLNIERMTSYLALDFLNSKETFYKEINKIEPSCLISIDCKRKIYSSYEYENVKNNKELKEIPDEFERLFERSVSNSIKSSHKSAIMLSGGLDSSAVTIALTKLGYVNLETYSANFSHLTKQALKLSDEKEFQEIISGLTPYKHFSISLENISPLKSLDNHLDTFKEPFHMPNAYLFDQIVSKATSRGIQVIIDGQDGDNVISHGLERFLEMFRNLKLFSLISEIFDYAEFNKIKKINLIRFLLNQLIIKIGIKRKVSKNNTILTNKVFYDKSIYNPSKRSALDSHFEKINSPHHALAFEYRYKYFKKFKIHTRSPFYDKKLINFCLNLNSKWKLNKGKTRYILRLYLENKVPEKLYNRRSKANLSYGIINNITLEDLKKIRLEIDNIHKALSPLVDRNKIIKILEKEKSALNDQDVTKLFAFYLANRWLKLNNNIWF